MVRIKPGDFFILAFIIILTIFSFILFTGKKNSTVLVTAVNDEYRYSLSNDGIYKVEGLIGTTTIEIKDGKVRISDSPCPNKTCIEQGWGHTIICLPNQVIVTVENMEDFDGIAQ